MSHLGIKLLGTPEASVGCRILNFRTSKTCALLYYLAAEEGMQHRDTLAELLWPQSVEGRATLRSALANLRKTFDTIEVGLAEECLVVERDRIGLRFESKLRVDLHTLRDALKFTRRTPEEELEMLRGAATVYRGEFLKSFYVKDVPEFDLWVGAERETWRLRAGEAFGRLSRLETEEGDPAAAEKAAEAWVTCDPASEAATIRHMETRRDVGDPEGAVFAYEEYRSTVKKIDLEPGAEVDALVEALRSKMPARWSRTHEKKRRMKQAPSVDDLSIPLMDRAEEFGALIAEYRAAASGDFGIVTVLGEGGMGKTRLAEDFLRWAAAEGAEVLRGRVREAGDPPYGSVVGALRERMERERAPDDLLEDVWLTELSRILPELRERYQDLPVPASDETAKGRLFEAIVRFGCALADRAPVVFFLDDLQWADAATREMLYYACEHWARQEAPILLVLCVSTESCPDLAAEERLSSFESELPVRRLSLGPIGEESTLALVRKLADKKQEECSSAVLERLGHWLYAETSGHPLFVSQTIRALIERGLLSIVIQEEDGKASVRVREGTPDEVSPEDSLEARLRGFEPAGVRELIHGRLSHLSPDAASLAAAAAVVGGDFSFDSLLKVSGIGEQDALSAIDELLNGRLLRYSETRSYTANFSFSHDRVRQVAYTEAGEARRYIYHRRALTLLKDRLSATELARHALAAGETKAAFSHLIEAGDEALSFFAASDASGQYERAMELLREQTETLPAARRSRLPAEEIEHLYVNLGRARELTGEWDQAGYVYEQMRDYARTSREWRLEVVALNRLAILYAQQWFDLPKAISLLEEALEVAVVSGDRLAMAETGWNLCQMRGLSMDGENAIANGEKALELARELGLKELEARCFGALAIACFITGGLKECSRHAHSGAELYSALERSDMEGNVTLSAQYIWAGSPYSSSASNQAMRSHCLALLSAGEFGLGNLKVATEAGREAVEIGREIESDSVFANGATALHLPLNQTGEYEESLALTTEALEVVRDLSSPVLHLLLLSGLGEVQQALLRLEEAQTTFLEASKLAEANVSTRYWRSEFTAGLCTNRMLAGDPEAAHGYAREFLEMEESPKDWTWSNFEKHYGTEALLLGGDEELARQDAQRTSEQAGQNRRHQLVYLRMLAILARWDGKSEAAVSHLREAERLAKEMGMPRDLWEVRAALGELYEAQGDIEQARKVFAAAADVVLTLAEKIGDERLRQDFLSAPQVQDVLEWEAQPRRRREHKVTRHRSVAEF